MSDEAYGLVMSNIGSPRTKLQREGTARARALQRDLAEAVRSGRESAGLSRRALARAAGVSHETIRAIEEELGEPSLAVMSRVFTVLGGQLQAYVRWGAGPLIRDHLQAPAMTALGAMLGPAWRLRLEVKVATPVTAAIDGVLQSTRDTTWVATEMQSRLRRIEQQIRWANVKADALAAQRSSVPPEATSRLLLLRSTTETRAVVAQYGDLLQLAYPAPIADTLASLRGDRPWPGPALLWCRISSGRAEILETPPRGIRLGR